MKQLFFLSLTLLLVVSSCNTADENKEQQVTPTSNTLQSDSSALQSDAHYFWSAELGNKGGLVMKRLDPIAPDSLNVSSVINTLNGLYPEVKLELKKVAGDSIFIDIKKSTYLTQQMGSSGAEAYLAEVTYNLTEIPNMNFVNIRFKEGDHAAPGTFTRTDFVH